jgi:glyoxylase-like metal-dependent hydrolase (beta-lactamase superfamily II)
MKRREFLAASSVSLVAAALKDVPAFAQAPAAPAPKFEELRRGVGTFSMNGGTIGWLITRDGLAVVDTQFANTAPACLEGLKQRSSQPIDVLVNTHHHGDHTGGNKVFRPAVKTIVAHANSATWQKNVAVAAKTEADQAYPDHTFTDAWKTTVGDETISAKYYGAGHTSGDVVVLFEKANVVHMGDLMFNRLHPRVDRPAGASIQSWIGALGKIPGDHDADTLYIFGHAKPGFGVTGARAELTRFRSYLTALLDYTRAQMKAGKSKEEIAKATSLAGFEDVVSMGTVLTLSGVLGTAYDELAGA